MEDVRSGAGGDVMKEDIAASWLQSLEIARCVNEGRKGAGRAMSM